jgi:hypothetical protein
MYRQYQNRAEWRGPHPALVRIMARTLVASSPRRKGYLPPALPIRDTMHSAPWGYFSTTNGLMERTKSSSVV